ncbi:MAG: helix-turn-helix domain-containing protein [Bacteroidales bacterium]|nr:helix-turn-helix domain-containing protein [Bacteroidales bacterium]
MEYNYKNNNVLSLLESYSWENEEDIAKRMADDFRQRRIEKNLTRRQVAEQSGVALSNIVRFEQKGLISLQHLLAIAKVTGHSDDLRQAFANPKYSTMEELTQIRQNAGRKKSYQKRSN